MAEMECYCDSDEEVFWGPVTAKELEITWRNRIAERNSSAKEVATAEERSGTCKSASDVPEAGDVGTKPLAKTDPRKTCFEILMESNCLKYIDEERLALNGSFRNGETDVEKQVLDDGKRMMILSNDYSMISTDDFEEEMNEDPGTEKEIVTNGGRVVSESVSFERDSLDSSALPDISKTLALTPRNSPESKFGKTSLGLGKLHYSATLEEKSCIPSEAVQEFEVYLGGGKNLNETSEPLFEEIDIPKNKDVPDRSCPTDKIGLESEEPVVDFPPKVCDSCASDLEAHVTENDEVNREESFKNNVTTDEILAQEIGAFCEVSSKIQHDIMVNVSKQIENEYEEMVNDNFEERGGFYSEVVIEADENILSKTLDSIHIEDTTEGTSVNGECFTKSHEDAVQPVDTSCETESGTGDKSLVSGGESELGKVFLKGRSELDPLHAFNSNSESLLNLPLKETCEKIGETSLGLGKLHCSAVLEEKSGIPSEVVQESEVYLGGGENLNEPSEPLFEEISSPKNKDVPDRSCLTDTIGLESEEPAITFSPKVGDPFARDFEAHITENEVDREESVQNNPTTDVILAQEVGTFRTISPEIQNGIIENVSKQIEIDYDEMVDDNCDEHRGFYSEVVIEADENTLSRTLDSIHIEDTTEGTSVNGECFTKSHEDAVQPVDTNTSCETKSGTGAKSQVSTGESELGKVFLIDCSEFDPLYAATSDSISYLNLPPKESCEKFSETSLGLSNSAMQIESEIVGLTEAEKRPEGFADFGSPSVGHCKAGQVIEARLVSLTPISKPSQIVNTKELVQYRVEEFVPITVEEYVQHNVEESVQTKEQCVNLGSVEESVQTKEQCVNLGSVEESVQTKEQCVKLGSVEESVQTKEQCVKFGPVEEQPRSSKKGFTSRMNNLDFASLSSQVSPIRGIQIKGSMQYREQKVISKPKPKLLPRAVKQESAQAKGPLAKAKAPLAQPKPLSAQAKTPSAQTKAPSAQAKAPPAQAKTSLAKAKAPVSLLRPARLQVKRISETTPAKKTILDKGKDSKQTCESLLKTPSVRTSPKGNKENIPKPSGSSENPTKCSITPSSIPKRKLPTSIPVTKTTPMSPLLKKTRTTSPLVRRLSAEEKFRPRSTDPLMSKVSPFPLTPMPKKIQCSSSSGSKNPLAKNSPVPLFITPMPKKTLAPTPTSTDFTNKTTQQILSLGSAPSSKTPLVSPANVSAGRKTPFYTSQTQKIPQASPMPLTPMPKKTHTRRSVESPVLSPIPKNNK